MLDYSHFISLPLALHSDLVQKLVKFQSTILGEIAESDSGETDDSGDKSESQSVYVQLEVEEKKDQVRVGIAKRVVGSGSKSRILSGKGSLILAILQYFMFDINWYKFCPAGTFLLVGT